MSAGGGWVGARLARKEDPPLLTGNARFIDDLAPVPGIRHVALLRAPHAHARIESIDVSGALAIDGVGVVTGAELAAVIKPIASAIRAPLTYYPMAVEKVRYAGEPVVLVAASDRYLAEDALEAISVDYRPLDPVVDAIDALADGAPLVHEAAGSNLVHDRRFRYGDPDRAFAAADHVVSLAWRYPRQSCTPIETCGAIAHFEAHPDRYTVWSNFQGPFILHGLMSASLGVPGNRLRLITPPFSGGSFGIKQAMFPTMILLAAASRMLGVPLKWIEDRLENLQTSSCASDRADEVEGAFTGDGELIGLRYRNLMNAGAYVRAPEPASLYRMHAASNGCYRVRDIEIENRVVVTNLPPVGLNRGYGGPQFYYALERLMEEAGRELGIDAAELRRRNLIPKDAFPYEAPAGAVYDAGDYGKGLDQALALAGYESLVAERKRARAEGRLYGIGIAMGVEPSGSNMAYVTLAQSPEERARAGGRSGGLASATVSFDPSGAVTVRTVSTPAGQGHATAAAQVVADRLGVHPDDVTVVTEADTLTSDWSLASGNYSNRFAAVVVDAIAEASQRVAARLARIAGDMLEVAPEDIELADGHARIVGVPEKGIPIRRVAARAHWHPLGLPAGEAMLRETAVVSPPLLDAPDEADRVASAVTFGFVCDLTAVEIDQATGRLTVHKYVSVHDCGTVLNPLLVEGQVHGGFAHGLGAALFEELVHDDAGTFLSGSFADYLCPTAPEMPPLATGLCATPSPRNALGSKGMGDGSAMLAPAVFANAVADALGHSDIEVPLTLNRLWALANGRPFERRLAGRVEGVRAGALAGDGSLAIAAPAEEVWRCLLDAEALARVLPGCRRLERSGEARFSAEVLIGVAGVSGVYDAEIELHDLRPPRSLRLVGRARGAMGWGMGEAEVALEPGEDGTVLSYRYAADVGGKVAAVGQRMLGTVTRALIARFFAALERELRPRPARPAWLQRVFGR
jgi:2-furoyl-CoA dehydrogenase large subunit